VRNEQRTRLAWISGLSGLALILLGGSMYYRERKALGFMSGLGRAPRGQAPMVGSYNDGKMKTTLRASADMPIETRIATIQELIHKSVQDPQMRKLALQITSQCGERDKVCEARAVYDYIKKRVRYTGDIGPIKHPDGSVEGIDLYQSARRTLEFGGGDCDDQAILGATLLALNGHSPVLRVVKSKRAPDWEHIFTGSNLDGKFVAIDTTLPGNRHFGIEPNYAKRVDFPA
jgi:hypothetical protein